MNELINLRVDLGINAQKIMQQVQIHNQSIESLVEKGINLALQDIINEDDFVEGIRAHCKQEMKEVVNKAVMSWEVRGKIQKMIEDKVGAKISEFSDRIAESIVIALEK